MLPFTMLRMVETPLARGYVLTYTKRRDKMAPQAGGLVLVQRAMKAPVLLVMFV